MKIFKGEIIKRARKEKGLTTREVVNQAMELGTKIDHSTLTRWENLPTAKPRPQALRTVCEILEIKENELFEEVSEELSEEEIDTLEIISRIIQISKVDNTDIRLKKINKILFPEKLTLK